MGNIEAEDLVTEPEVRQRRFFCRSRTVERASPKESRALYLNSDSVFETLHCRSDLQEYFWAIHHKCQWSIKSSNSRRSPAAGR